MNIKDIRLLVKLMVDGDLRELDIRDGDSQVHLKRGYAEGPVVLHQQVAPAAAPAAAAPAAPAAAGVDSGASTAPTENLLEIKSPMVGTFYAASDPDSPAYVSVGSPVDDESVVCIVEAMKVMNEIKAECRGTVVEVCVKNAQPIEFGQVLFRVRPA